MEITPVNPPWESRQKGKHYYSIANTLFEIDEKYIPLKFLGRGAYGVVCSAYNRQTNEKVAIKKIANVFEYKIDAIRTLRELMLSRYIHHENLVYLKDVMIPANWWDFKEVYMVYELMDTDLDHIIRSPQRLSNDHCQFFMFQLLSGLKYIHSANVLHRDLKPGNILINGNCELKICDFGLARTAGKVMTEYVVTRWYRAPELLLSCGKYGSAVDMWSVGCIFAEILGRKPIFPGKDGLDQIKLIINLLGSQADADLSFIDNPRAKRFIMSLKYPNESCLRSLFPSADPLAVDLLEKMLVFDPSKRISVSEALCHPYMSDLYDPKANPPAEHRLNLDLDDDIEESAIREMMLQEILRFHPESAYVNLEC